MAHISTAHLCVLCCLQKVLFELQSIWRVPGLAQLPIVSCRLCDVETLSGHSLVPPVQFLTVVQVKNRESAARSRQRKQAYTTELEEQVRLFRPFGLLAFFTLAPFRLSQACGSASGHTHTEPKKQVAHFASRASLAIRVYFLWHSLAFASFSEPLCSPCDSRAMTSSYCTQQTCKDQSFKTMRTPL